MSTKPVDIVFVADKNHDFDFFIFTQQWPVTRCILLAENHKYHICAASTFDEKRWTIYGIWPTRVGTRSPAYCNKGRRFDFKQLDFIDELSEYWVNIGNDTSATLFWQHEWTKHGTCCAGTELENEKEFYSQGLIWLRQFNMSQILETAGVTPGGEYKAVNIHNVVYKKLNKIPSIHCASTKDGTNYLSEIRLCFSKSLELIDCQVTGNAEVVFRSAASPVEVLTNCNLHKNIIYSESFPQTDFEVKFTNPWRSINWLKVVDSLKQSLV